MAAARNAILKYMRVPVKPLSLNPNSPFSISSSFNSLISRRLFLRRSEVLSSTNPRSLIASFPLSRTSRKLTLLRQELGGHETYISLLELLRLVTPSAHFQNDLGLDSLDSVEIVMALEEEFRFEIPDNEADKISSINVAVDFIASHPQAK
ncbi:Acyl carrier protein 2 mitochondrial [Bienertia sinuspersici]